jgi:hypothetical protein
MVAQLETSMIAESTPRDDCTTCRGGGLSICSTCGGRGERVCDTCHGDGRAGGVIECACLYSPSVQASLRCLTYNGTGKQKCSCFRDMRVRWTDCKEVLGSRVASIHMMAERNSVGPWEFYARDDEQTEWLSFPSTTQARARAEEILTRVTAQKQAAQFRQDLHSMADSLPDTLLQAARDAIKDLQNGSWD